MSFFKEESAQLPEPRQRRGADGISASRRVGSGVAMATVDQSSIRGLATA